MTTEQSAAQPSLPRWRRPLPRKLLLWVLVAGLGVGVLTIVLSDSSSARSDPGAPTSNPASGLNRANEWMISVGALNRIKQTGLPQNLVTSFFNQPASILIGKSSPSSNQVAPRASAAFDFTSATALIKALQNKRVPASVPDVVLDLEAWPLTPLTEQQNPIAAADQAFKAAHAAGKQLIFTPGVDLIRVLTGQRLHGSALSSAYDRLLAKPGASVSNIFEIQAQGTEGTAEVPSFVNAALQAARSAHPKIPVLVGLSTNPSGRLVTPEDLLQLAQAALRGGASGFWLNVPEAGKACPRCGTAQPQVAVTFLEELVRFTSPNPTHPIAPSAPRDNTASSAGLLDSAGHLLAAGGQPADWILAASQFAAVVGQPGVTRLMGGGTIYEPVSARQTPSKLLPVTPTLVVHSEILLSQLVAQHQLSPDIQAVLYDNERFADTPVAEQSDPLSYDQKVTGLAAANHWVTICDLIEPDRLPIGMRDPAQEVPPCTIIGLNTVQQSERQPAQYTALVTQDVNIIHKIRPTATVLAGLSANPRGGPVTASELTADIRATHDLVQGYWLNVPAPGIGCPACGLPDPNLMASALKQLVR